MAHPEFNIRDVPCLYFGGRHFLAWLQIHKVLFAHRVFAPEITRRAFKEGINLLDIIHFNIE